MKKRKGKGKVRARSGDSAKPIARADTETTGLSVYQGGRPFAVSMRFKDETLYWEWVVDPFSRRPYLKVKDIREIRSITADRKVVKCFFNAQFDIPMLEAIGCPVRGQVEELYFKVRACYSFLISYELKTLCRNFLKIGNEDQKGLQRAVVKARRLAKKLGWNIATLESGYGTKPVMADYWLPGTLWALEPEKAKAAEIPKGVCAKYAKLDAVRTEDLDNLFIYGMTQVEGANKVYEFEVRELLPIVMGMIRRGVAVDPERLAQCEAECRAQLDSDMAVLNKLWNGGLGLVQKTGSDFNPDAAVQVQKLMFDKLDIPVLSRTKKTGAPKTGGEFLLPYADRHPAVKAVLSARANRKALSTFFGKYRSLADYHQGGLMILHPGLNQWGTGTCRFTCKSPNLQQVSDPKNTDSKGAEFVVDVRQVFIPRPGCWWYGMDYKQLEVIVFADLAQVETMLEAIRSGADIHSATTDKVWAGEDNSNLPKTAVILEQILNLDELKAWDGKPEKGIDHEKQKEVVGLLLGSKGRVTVALLERLLEMYGWSIATLEKAIWSKVFRKRAKAVTFLKIFGGGIIALMALADLARREASELLKDYDQTFPEIRIGSQAIIGQAARDGYIVNAYGRRIQVDRQMAYRAVNYLVQSSAAELMKRGMVKCYNYLEETGLDAQIVLTIHDELIFEFRKEDAFKSVLRKLRDLMADHEGVFTVPTPVDVVKITERWSEKTEVVL